METIQKNADSMQHQLECDIADLKVWLTPVCFLQPVVNESEVTADPCLFSAASENEADLNVWLTPGCFLQPAIGDRDRLTHRWLSDFTARYM